MTFYLGTHHPHWLGLVRAPLFVSRRWLALLRTLPRAIVPWALDSGGFSELSLFGRWETSPEQYVAEVRRFRAEVGRLAWAAVQDWMCEPFMLAKTGLSLRDHQRLTVRSYLELASLAPEVPWVPVLQGWRVGDHVEHMAMYARSGVSLERFPVVGVGSVCRRQGTAEVLEIFRELAGMRLRLHGFGLKVKGLPGCSPYLVSADSLAWSRAARWQGEPLLGCVGHKNCANCPRYALRWRRKVLDLLEGTCTE